MTPSKTAADRRKSRAVPEIDRRIIKALGHPLRMEILTLLHLKEASPSDLADELGQPLANVSYHVRLLADLDCIELVGTAQRRGAVEHYYRARERPFFDEAAWAELPPPVRRSVSDAVLRQIWKDVRAAIESGSFDADPGRHLSRMPLVLDRTGWEELNELMANLLEEANRIQVESMGRLKDAKDEGAMATRLMMMHFEFEPTGKDKRARKPAKRARKRAR
jgi:DNA-binding transcriptional ArsR family regulator